MTVLCAAAHRLCAGEAMAHDAWLPAQVRQRIYGKAVGRWRRYAAELRPAAEVLQPLIDSYEAGLRSAGLLGGHAEHDEL